MKNTGVIFDLDGTLVDSVEDLADSLNLVLREHNLPIHDIDTYKRLVGSGLKKLVHDALPAEHRSGEIYSECVSSMFEIYNANCLIKTRPYNGVVEMLDELDSNEIKYAVLSNKADEFTKKIVRSLFPNRKFKFVAGVTNETEKKPNPYNALKLSKQLGLQPDEILYVGDSGIDMQTANNAGMIAVGVLWGFKPKEELEQNGAKYILNQPFEFIQLIRHKLP